MYNETVTVFNRYVSRSGVMWYPTVIHNVNVNLDRAAIVAKYGETCQDNLVLNVRYTINDSKEIVVAGKIYHTPKEWKNLTNDDLARSITFAPGAAFDLVYIGEWSDEEPIDDTEYDVEGFYEYMDVMYDHVYVVTATARYSVIPHFEVTGR